MALSCTFVFIFGLGLGLFTTLSSIQTLFRLFSETEHLNFTQIVSQYGYVSENHTVQTEDGYLLNLYRITHSVNCNREKIKSPVLLINGLLASANSFLDAGVDNGLPYLIADACYDIWLGNARGSYEGRRHVTLDPDNDKAFWDFSVDEIGKYDVPATIDFVLNHTGEQQLNYIGVSQGSGSFFVACSERPEYSDKVKLMIGLAPASKHTHAKSVLFRTATTFIRDYQSMLESLGLWELMWKDMMEPIRMLCQYKPEVCYFFVDLLDAPHPGSISKETLLLALEHFPAGTSTKNLARFGQSVNGDRYCKFDYGPERNMELYGGEPPEFNLSAVKAPTYLLHGKNDGIVDYKDMEWLVSQLPNVKEFMLMEDPLWHHLDMVLHKNLRSTLVPKILNYLKLYNNNEETTMTVIYSNDTVPTVVSLPLINPELRLVGQTNSK